MKHGFRSFRGRRSSIFLVVMTLLMGIVAGSTPAPIHAMAQQGVQSVPSTNLVWKPYLQQVTSSSIIILWSTLTGSNPVVEYSIDTSYSSSVTGTSRPLTDLATQFHRVALTGLQANTTYHYKVFVDGEDLLPDETLTFKTAPSVGSTSPFKFIAFSDYGTGASSQKALRDRMLADSFDFILTAGDNSQETGAYADYDAYVFKIYQDILSHTPLFTAPGNHDYKTNNAAPYLDVFDLPTNAWLPSDQERYYSFDYANVHFVVLDTVVPLYVNDATATNDMFDWLRSDLAATTQPWKIVSLHYPAYSTSHHGSTPAVDTKLVPIFEQYGVDLVFQGHDHVYTRSYPLLGGQISTLAAGGIVYMQVGSGSSASYPCTAADWEVIYFCSVNYGIYSRVTVNNNSLLIEGVKNDGTIVDSYTMSQGANIPPTVTINSGPLQPYTAGTTAVFGFTATPGSFPIDHVECSLDSAPFAACSSPATLSSLAEGAHTYTVRAFDTGGNISNTATYVWTVDATKPVVTISAGPKQPYSTKTSATFSFSATDGLSGVDHQECALDSASFTACTSPQALTTVAEGAHTFNVRAFDKAGNLSNTAVYNWTIDVTKPVSSINTGPTKPYSSSTAATFTFSAADNLSGIANLTCALDSGAYTPCTSPVTVTGLSVSKHVFYVRAMDGAGIQGNPVYYIWYLDLTKPVATITSGPIQPYTTKTSATFTFSATDDLSGVDHLECALDAAPFTTCFSGKTITPIAQGAHTYYVRAVDKAGNVGTPVSYGWTVDTTKPASTINSGPTKPYSSSTSATFTFSAIDNLSGINHYECALDAGAYAPCTSPVTLTGLTLGKHSFFVRAVDGAEMLGNPVYYTWIIQ